MNGSVVPLLEKPKHDEIKSQLAGWINTFYNGEKLSVFEKDLERQYINEKRLKAANFEKTKSMRYKVNWTISDLNRY